MATHSSVLAWRIPGMGSHRVRHNRSDLAAVASCPIYTVFILSYGLKRSGLKSAINVCFSLFLVLYPMVCLVLFALNSTLSMRKLQSLYFLLI